MTYALKIALVILIVFTSCVKDSDDNSGPEISIEINGLASDTAVVSSGMLQDIDLSFIDESNIHSFKLEVLLDDVPDSYSCELISEWSYLLVEDDIVEGVFDQTIEVMVPDSVYGFYAVSVQAFDEFGNIDSEDLMLEITNSEKAKITSITTDSLISTCSFYSDSLSITEVNVEGECDSGFSTLNVYQKDGGELNLIDVYSLFNVVMLNDNFSLNGLVNVNEVDSLCFEFVSADQVSIWSELEIVR